MNLNILLIVHIVDTNGFIGRNVTRYTFHTNNNMFSTILEKNVHKIHWLNTFNFTFDAFNKSQNVNTNNKTWRSTLHGAHTKHKTSKELRAEKKKKCVHIQWRIGTCYCIVLNHSFLVIPFSHLFYVLLKCKFHMAISLIFFVSFSS